MIALTPIDDSAVFNQFRARVQPTDNPVSIQCHALTVPNRTHSGLSAAAPSESRLGEAVMDAEVANCSASKHGPGQSVKFLAAREHIDNQLYALDLCL